jgi:photosystem II stability/assembly factor-like uncharacterized protein
MQKRYAALLLACFAPALIRAADERTCTMRDAAMPAPSLTYVLCEQGLLLVTTDEGVTWNTRKIADAQGLKALAFLDINRGLAAGDGGVILATADAGKTWTPRKTGTTENLADLQMVGEEGWAAGFDGVILHTTDGGQTWSAQKSGVTQSIEAIQFLDTKNGWAVGWSGTILHTTDGGATWKQVKTTNAMWSLSSIHFLDANTGFISGFAGQLLRTRDGGATWEGVKTPYSGWLTSVTFDSKNRGWITTDDGFLLSADGGTTWKLTTAGAAAEGQTQLFLSKLLRTSGVTWALGPFGLAKQVGDGTQWKKIENPLADNGGK